MFDIGFWELVLIAIVALVVLGPERLPHAIRSVAKFVSAAKSMANSVKDELAHELKVQELQENLRKAEQMGMQNLSPELQNRWNHSSKPRRKCSVLTPQRRAVKLALPVATPVRLQSPMFASIARRNRRKKRPNKRFLSSLYQELS